MAGKIVDIPTLDSLVANPGLVQALPKPVVQHLLIQITSLLPLLIGNGIVSTTEKTQEDRLLGVDEAAAILGKTKDALYRHADELPFTVRERRLLRFSNNGIQKYIQARLRQG